MAQNNGLRMRENLSFQVLTGFRTCKTDRRGTLSWARAMHVRIQARGKLVAAEKGVDGQWKDGCMSLEQAFKQHGHFIYPTSHGQVTPNSKDTPVAAGVTTLDFQGSRVGDAGVRKVAHILKANTTITTLNLAWSALEDVSATRLADALWCNTVLRSLDLSNNEITDAGATSLACALDGGLDGKVLEIEQTAADDFWESEIPLQANVGSLAGMTATHDLHKSLKKKPHLASGEPHSTKSLKILNSEGVLSNGLQVGNCTLQSINLGYNRLGEEGMKRVLEMFRKNEGITSISLAGAGKAPKGSDFGSVLQHNRLLRVLNLSGIGLTADAGLSLSNILSPAAGFSSLTKLQLASNKLGNEGATALATSLHPIQVADSESVRQELLQMEKEQLQQQSTASQHHHHHHGGRESASRQSQGSSQGTGSPSRSPVSRVFRRDRRASEHFQAMILERTQQHPFLTSLDLRDNGIRSEGMTSISSMLRQNRTLQHLVLLDNVCGDDGALELVRGAQRSPHLETLFFYDNSIGFDSVQEISEMLRQTELVTKDMVFDFGHLDDRDFELEASGASEFDENQLPLGAHAHFK